MPMYYSSNSFTLWDAVSPSQRVTNTGISFEEFQSLITTAFRYTRLKPEIYPERWMLINCQQYLDKINLARYEFEDVHNGQNYVVNSNKMLLEIKNIMSGESIQVNIPLPDNIWFRIEFNINRSESIIKQRNQMQAQKHKNYEISGLYNCTSKSSKKETLTKDEAELVELMESIQDKSFDEIFNAITKYRIKRYNKGLTNDIVMPYKKIKNNFNKLKTILSENNYEQFSSLKKWVDKVIFLDKEQ